MWTDLTCIQGSLTTYPAHHYCNVEKACTTILSYYTSQDCFHTLKHRCVQFKVTTEESVPKNLHTIYNNKSSKNLSIVHIRIRPVAYPTLNSVIWTVMCQQHKNKTYEWQHKKRNLNSFVLSLQMIRYWQICTVDYT